MNEKFIYYDNKAKLYVWCEIKEYELLLPIYSSSNIPMKYDFSQTNESMIDNLNRLFGEI